MDDRDPVEAGNVQANNCLTHDGRRDAETASHLAKLFQRTRPEVGVGASLARDIRRPWARRAFDAPLSSYCVGPGQSRPIKTGACSCRKPSVPVNPRHYSFAMSEASDAAADDAFTRGSGAINVPSATTIDALRVRVIDAPVSGAGP